MKTSDPFLDADAIRAATFVRHIELHDTLASTNNQAAELARCLSPQELPALVVARRQTAGRGRGRNVWWSADGALTFSLLVEPAGLGISPANWPQLSLTTAVAMCDALELRIADCGLRNEKNRPQAAIHTLPTRLGIKWPNDVFLDSRKICGILIESPGGAAPAKDRLIIGVGINVNNTWRDAPADIRENGIALCNYTGQQHPLSDILQDTLCAFATRVEQVRSKVPALSLSWRQLNLLARQIVAIETAGRRIEGECVDIAPDGALVVQTATGPVRCFSGTVRLASRQL